MARIRSIKPEFWEDEKISKIPLMGRLFYIGCWNFSDDYGFFRGNYALLKSQLFPYDNKVTHHHIKKWLDILMEMEMVFPLVYNGEKYYWIRTFTRHQKIDKRYDKSFLGKEVVPEIINELLISYEAKKNLPQREHSGDTPQDKDKDMERDMEKERRGRVNELHPDPDSKEADASSLSPEYLKFREWMETNAPYCASKLNFPGSVITEKEFLKLRSKYSKQQIVDVIVLIENRKDLRKKYSNLYCTVSKWAKTEYGE